MKFVQDGVVIDSVKMSASIVWGDFKESREAIGFFQSQAFESAVVMEMVKARKKIQKIVEKELLSRGYVEPLPID